MWLSDDWVYHELLNAAWQREKCASNARARTRRRSPACYYRWRPSGSFSCHCVVPEAERDTVVVLSSPTNECYVSVTFTAASHTATFNSPQRVIQRNRMRGAKGDLDREEEPDWRHPPLSLLQPRKARYIPGLSWNVTAGGYWFCFRPIFSVESPVYTPEKLAKGLTEPPPVSHSARGCLPAVFLSPQRSRCFLSSGERRRRQCCWIGDRRDCFLKAPGSLPEWYDSAESFRESEYPIVRGSVWVF